MPQDPWLQYAVTPGAAPPTEGAVSSGDPWLKYAATPSSAPSANQPENAPSQSQPSQASADPWLKYASEPASGTGTPEAGIPEHDESDRFTQEDPNEDWLQKSWSFANKPLTESLFGWGQYRQGAGGVERFVEKTASGFSSPLSLALIAAFAPAGIAEGVAGTALKEGLTEGADFLGGEALDGVAAAQKVETYAKAVEAAQKAKLAGSSIRDAVEATGLKNQEFQNYGQYLRNQGMQETDILGSNLARVGISRVASQSLKSLGVTPAKALNIAKGVESLVNFGFGVQMAKGAVYAYPRAFDLLSKGDYDDAAEYLLDAGAGTVFGGLGLAHGLYSIHDILPGVNEKENLPLDDASVLIDRTLGKYKGEITSAQSDNAARRRSDLADIMEFADVPVPAGLRVRVPFSPEEDTRLSELQKLETPTADEAKELTTLQDKKTLSQTRENQTTFIAELHSALSGIMANKAQADRLLQAHKYFFTLLDSGADPNLMFQKAVAMREVFGLQPWWDEQGYKNITPKERNIEDIATEEKSGTLAASATAKEAGAKLTSLNEDLKGATDELKKANAETAPNIQKTIEDLKQQINDSQLEKAKLDQKAEDTKDWNSDDPARREAAFRRLYDSHVQDVKDAEKSTPWDSPTAKELFREKVRALAWRPQDLSIIANEYPHFEHGPSPEQSRSNVFLYNPEYYTERLQNPELVQKSVAIATPAGEAIAVPTGGARAAGSLDYTYSEDERPQAEYAVEELKKNPDFINPRVVKTGRGALEVQWGEDLSKPIAQNVVTGILKNVKDKANQTLDIAKDRESYAQDDLDRLYSEKQYLQNRVEALEELGNNNQNYNNRDLEAAKIQLDALRKRETIYKDSHDFAADRLEEAQRASQEAELAHQQALKGKFDPKWLRPQDRADIRGQLYGYHNTAINDYIDANKSFFTGPDIEAAKALTKTRNFLRWWKSSKVVDENNDPLVVFHGTTADWNTFDPQKAFSKGSLGLHAGSLSQARDFVRDRTSSKDSPIHGGKIMPLFLSIQNPLRTNDMGTWRPERVVANLTKYGIKDTEHKVPSDVSDRPQSILHDQWFNSTDAQKIMYSEVEKRIQKELANGDLDDNNKELYNRRQELYNKYVIDLIEHHGYDGMVYKNVGEGELSVGGRSGTHSSGDSYIAFHPNQIKSATGNNGEFSSDRNNILENKIYDTAPKREELSSLKNQLNALNTAVNSGKDPDQIDKLTKKYAALSKKVSRLEGRDMGEVHKLNDGTKVAYLSFEALKQLRQFLGRKSVPAGTVLNDYSVRWIRTKIENSSLPDWKRNSLLNLIENSRNDNGDMVIANDEIRNFGKPSSSYQLKDALWTLREELVHHWQSFFADRNWGNHLSEENTNDLRDTMPEELVDHLKRAKYIKDGEKEVKHMSVIEGAAKLMATQPEQTMLTLRDRYGYNRLKRLESEGVLPEEGPESKATLKELEEKVADLRAKAKVWINKYFSAVEEKHGDAAFDKLTHVTTLARHWNEEYRNAGIHDTESGQGEENVGPVEAEGSSGSGRNVGGGGPPEPPGEEPFDWRKYFGGESNGILGDLFQTEPWQYGPQHPALPPNLVEEVNKYKSKKWKPEQIEYAKSMIKAYMEGAQGMSPKAKEIYNSLRKADDDNWTVGYNNGIIHSIVPNHIHHIWGEDDQNKKGYPADEEARSGAFAINATQARHRAWSTAFEGLIQGRQLAVHDPSAIVAHDADEIATAAAHRKAIDLIRKGIKLPDGTYVSIKDPEGMPGAVMVGAGRQVPGVDGGKAANLVNPNIVRNVYMEPSDVKNLFDSGLLSTYLKDGRVKDQTPQVGQGNVKEWIQATRKKLSKLGEKNPLLSTTGERTKHEAGWNNIKDFATNQAKKISEYLDEALDRIKNHGEIDKKGNFASIPASDKPDDINMVKYLGEVLHGKNGRITPADLVRLEEYAERNRNYAQGLNGTGEKDIIPSEISKLILQEQQHLPGHLVDYLNPIHDTFGKRDSDGNWTTKGMNTAVYHIAHAALNTEFPQLMKDLVDLEKVDNLYTGNLTQPARIAIEEELAKFGKSFDDASPDDYTNALKAIKAKYPHMALDETPITTALQKQQALEILKDINERQPKQYVWSPKGHITINHPSLHGWQWIATASDGTPTLAESDIAISRHWYRYIVNSLGLEPSWLRKNEGLGKVTGPLLKAGQQVKSTILSGSPFHVIQIALRALMLHVNPFVRPNPIAHLDENFEYAPGKFSSLRKGVDNSLTLFTDRNAAEDQSVGVASHGGVISKIPIYGPFTDQIHDFLFNRFIPSVKADAYRKMYSQYADAHPDWSEDAIAYKAAQHTNNSFGGINWREMGRSATTQDWFNLVALAPDWLESEMRFAAGLFNGYGIGPSKYHREEGKNFTRTQVAQAAVVLWTTARLLNKLYSGSPHYESPFGLVVKDKDGRDVEYSVRTLPTDILHATEDPMGFLTGRSSPIVRSAWEELSGRNQYGQKLTDSEKYVDLISNLSPIWGQAGFKKISKLSTSSDVGNIQQMVKAAGGTAQIHRTPAELTAANLASERSEEGSINPAQIARHRMLIQLEESVRAGKISSQDLTTLVDQGSLPEADAKNVIKVAKETMGLDPEQARMYSRTSRLDFQGADKVYHDANPTEKAILHDLIVKKAKAYLKKSLKDETPATRAQDPMFRQARRYAPLIPEPETQ